jgi:predicted SprT family Zn-dependent metalloprotease
MFIFCKTCKCDTEPGIDKNTLDGKKVVATTKVLCPTCRSELPMTSFMMQTLVGLGRFITTARSDSAFSFKCTPCDKIVPAMLSETKTEALCSSCKANLNVTSFMIKAMAIAKAGGGIDSQG